MVALTLNEILEGLIKLGITSSTDLKVYCNEYTTYFKHQYPDCLLNPGDFRMLNTVEAARK